MTDPFAIVAVASARAVVPSPTGFWIVTVGALVYPLPPSDISILEIVPAAETTAVAAAATPSALLNITTVSYTHLTLPTILRV